MSSTEFMESSEPGGILTRLTNLKMDVKNASTSSDFRFLRHK